MREGSRHEVVDALIEKSMGDVDNYFKAPHVMVELMELIDGPDTTAHQLAKIVEGDPSLTVSLLRQVNSAAYRFNGTISSVRDAVLLLGFNAVKYTCITRVMKRQFLQKGSHSTIIPREKFWHHSVATGIFAKILAAKSGFADPDTAYVAGVIHDIGWVGIELALPEATKAIIRDAEEEQIWPETREVDLLGISHADAGAWLIRKWNLPDAFETVTLCHHTPEKAGNHQGLAAVIHLADALGSMCFPFFSDRLIPEEPPEEAWKAIQLTEQVREEVVAQFSDEVVRMGEILRL